MFLFWGSCPGWWYGFVAWKTVWCSVRIVSWAFGCGVNRTLRCPDSLKSPSPYSLRDFHQKGTLWRKQKSQNAAKLEFVFEDDFVTDWDPIGIHHHGRPFGRRFLELFPSIKKAFVPFGWTPCDQADRTFVKSKTFEAPQPRICWTWHVFAAILWPFSTTGCHVIHRKDQPFNIEATFKKQRGDGMSLKTRPFLRFYVLFCEGLASA